MILMIDNYDSFTWNLVQGFRSLGAEMEVVRNDEIDVEGIAAKRPQAIVFSPGPGRPESAGVTLAAIRAFAGKVPLLGVCLGHQAIAEAFGGRVTRARRVMHGKTSRIRHDGKGIFEGLTPGFEAMRYHSLAVSRDGLPDCLEVSAESEDGEIMGLRHRELAVESVQYHPESVGTPEGMMQLKNFVDMAGRSVFARIMRGEMDTEDIKAYLTEMHDKGITRGDLVAAATELRKAGIRVRCDVSRAVDIVGTGGDHTGTFNVSTTAAFIAAGAGVTIAKHGNRAVTSKCGTADVLEALGFDLDSSVEQVEKLIAEVGIGFLFARNLHPAMRFAAPARKALPFKTIFNYVGPLINPAGVRRSVIGVADPAMTRVFADVMRLMGSERVLTLTGPDNIDEIATFGETRYAELRDGKVTEGVIDAPAIYGESWPMEAIRGGTAEENAVILRKVLTGELRGGYRMAAVMNAAAALRVADVTDDWKLGIEIAEESIDSGRALAKLRAMTGRDA